MNDSKSILVHYIMIIFDVATMFCVYLMANLIKFGNFRTGINNPEDYYLGLFVTSIMIYLLVTFLFFSGDQPLSRNAFREFFTIIRLECYVAALTIGYLYFTKSSSYYSRGQLAIYFGGSIIMVFIVRQVLKRIILKSYHRSGANEKIMLVTDYDSVPKIISKIKQTRNWYFRISNLAIIDRDVVGEDLDEFEVIANRNNLLEVIATAEIDTVFFHVSEEDKLDYRNLIKEIRSLGKNVRINIDEYHYAHGNRRIELLGVFPVVNFSTKRYRLRHMALKRFFDIVIGIIGSFFYLLLIPIISLCLLLEGDPGQPIIPILKVGKNGRKFYMLKFRTIARVERENKEQETNYKYTKTGRALKALGLENLPSAWNVLWGNVSLVGISAPTLSEFMDYPMERRKNLNVKPGLIGLWQVQKKHCSVEDADEYYLDNWNLWLDFKIIFRTMGLIFTNSLEKR